MVLLWAMNANRLQLELPEDQSRSLFPWIIVLICIAILVVQISQLTQRIPESLLQQASERIDQNTHPKIFVSADGRDLSVSGTTTSFQFRRSIVEQLSQIDGVLNVHDNMQVIDPAQEARQAVQQFESQLSAIDFSVIAFQPGSISFTPQSDAALTELHALLRQYPESRVRIEGHTDNTGADSVNVRVSRERADAVANYLMARGVRSQQLIVTGYGATQPVADNNTENGRARNRRIDVNPVN